MLPIKISAIEITMSQFAQLTLIENCGFLDSAICSWKEDRKLMNKLNAADKEKSESIINNYYYRIYAKYLDLFGFDDNKKTKILESLYNISSEPDITMSHIVDFMRSIVEVDDDRPIRVLHTHIKGGYVNLTSLQEDTPFDNQHNHDSWEQILACISNPCREVQKYKNTFARETNGVFSDTSIFENLYFVITGSCHVINVSLSENMRVTVVFQTEAADKQYLKIIFLIKVLYYLRNSINQVSQNVMKNIDLYQAESTLPCGEHINDDKIMKTKS